MHGWHRALKNHRDHSKATGIAMHLSEAEMILHDLWFENRLNQRFGNLNIQCLLSSGDKEIQMNHAFIQTQSMHLNC